MASPTQADQTPVNSPDRLDSWKEIAAYVSRSVPTVQRWEKNAHLPIHRHAHEKQGSVYAYKSELDRWYHESGAPSAQLVVSLPRNIAHQRLIRWPRCACCIKSFDHGCSCLWN